MHPSRRRRCLCFLFIFLPNPISLCLLLHSHPYNLYMQRLILGEKNQTHVPVDTVFDMQPHLAPGQASPQTMALIGIISHQGTKEQGHYVAITYLGDMGEQLSRVRERCTRGQISSTSAVCTPTSQTQKRFYIGTGPKICCFRVHAARISLACDSVYNGRLHM